MKAIQLITGENCGLSVLINELKIIIFVLIYLSVLVYTKTLLFTSVQVASGGYLTRATSISVNNRFFKVQVNLC